MDRIKLFLGISFALLLFFRSNSQTNAETPAADKSLKFFNKTEVGISFGIGSFKTKLVDGVRTKIRNDELIVTFQTINGVKYMNRLSLGASVGFEKWRNGFFWPIYGYIGFDFKPTGNTFFTNVYLGYSIGTRYATTHFEEGTGAFAFSIGVGYKMKIANKICFMYEIFYKYQALESSYGEYVTDTNHIQHLIKTVDYKIPLHFAGLKIGITIP